MHHVDHFTEKSLALASTHDFYAVRNKKSSFKISETLKKVVVITVKVNLSKMKVQLPFSDSCQRSYAALEN